MQSARAASKYRTSERGLADLYFVDEAAFSR